VKLRAKAWRSLVLLFIVIGAIWGTVLANSYEPVLGLDLQGGLSIGLSPVVPDDDPATPLDESDVKPAPGALEKAVDIIRERVDALGVAEPDITLQGDETIIVEIAGVEAEDQDRAFELIGSTAKLSFRPVLGRPGPGVPPDKLPTCADRDTYPKDVADEPVVYCFEREPGKFVRLALGPSALTGDLVTGARTQLDPSGQILGMYVELDLSPEGTTKFAAITSELACNRGQPGPGKTDQLAIVLDGIIRSAPSMGEGVECGKGIDDGQAIITGSGEDEAKDLALVLRYGALPVELKNEFVATVSPTLGRESLRNGLLASAIGVAIVFLYVLLFYRLLGVVIWLGIAIHAVVTFGMIILLGQVAGFSLSLAGIAGLIVSLGIAADSFIVYFERIKDEVGTGKPVRTAVERAWPSARRTIIAADIVTALAAGVLYVLAVGNVRGFAFMLGLSTTLDLIVSFAFMHPIVYLIGQTRRMRNARTLGVGVEARSA
jgi:protein-export membrane protein SecD